MRLFIAEKPSLGRAIADQLPKPLRKQEGCIYAANGDVVSWCFGHLLELAEPDQYDERYKRWAMEHLPIIPDQWQLKPKSKTRKQISVLRKLVKEASEIVHAGDPDREGQLLVDEVIEFLKVSATKRASIKRCLINDLNGPAVKKALNQLKPNSDYVPLSVSALARSRADWLYGMNMTRAYTLQGQKGGYKGVLSVGRVQTPVLGLVVRRDSEIENFQSKPFYEVRAQLIKESGEQFYAKWLPSEACQKWMDSENRVLSRALAENVAQRITGQPADIVKLDKKPKKNSPPLPYNLSALQIDANKLYGLTAQQVLDSCQSLYEKHKLITYPRSDCRYLPTEHLQEVNQVSSAVISNSGLLSRYQQLLNLTQKSKAWNDKKVEAHHAIIPTSKKSNINSLNDSEQKVYQLVARQYLYQFMPDHQYSETVVDIEIAGGLFRAKAKQVLEQGWKEVSFSSKVKQDDNEPQLPALALGETLLSQQGIVDEKHTQPPKPYTEATLLTAMTGIARHVSDPEIKKILKDTDGLGTEATRAGIIELLFKRNFLKRQGKNITSTPAGRALIGVLPEQVSRPDMTAHWEMTLEQISKRQGSYNAFMAQLTDQVGNLVQGSEGIDHSALSGIEQPKRSGKRNYRRRKSAKKAS